MSPGSPLLLLLQVLIVCVQSNRFASRKDGSLPMHTHDDFPAAERQRLMQLSKEEIIDLFMPSQDVREERKDVYWWVFPKQDCGWWDIDTKCQSGDVAGCKALCASTPGCAGFNTHGIMKKDGCENKKAVEVTVDLYVLKDSPQPTFTNHPPIWPHPLSFTNGSTKVYVDAINWKWESNFPLADLERHAYSRFHTIFFPNTPLSMPKPAPGVVITGCTIKLGTNSTVLQMETDESYNLQIPNQNGPVVVSAQTVYGAYHALSTLSQLIVFDYPTNLYTILATPWVVQDAPRFKHREVLMDSSRHFLPITTIKAFVDTLPFAKINVLHWHIVDSQSFPFDSPSNPRLSLGAYSVMEKFSHRDVADVVEYARLRGVRVMPEIDVPGHAASWCSGYPEICPSAQCLEPLNPATNATFDLLSRLLGDFTGGKRGSGIAFENLFHLGGDEVDTSCWGKTPEIAKWLKDQGYTEDQAYEYFVKRAQNIAQAQGRDVVGWEEIWNHFGTKLQKSTIIHQWLAGSTIAKEAIAAGYRVLWSTSSAWYLDDLHKSWQLMYDAEPCDGISDDACANLMLGGGGEMWGETIDTSDLQQTVWPRLGAIGERLWSSRELKSADAEGRYAAFRCFLNRKGIAATPYRNENARTSPPGPGGCYDQ